MDEIRRTYKLEKVLSEMEERQYCLEVNTYDDQTGIGFEVHDFFDKSRDERGDLCSLHFSHARIIDGPEESLAMLSFTESTEQEFVDAAWREVKGEEL